PATILLGTATGVAAKVATNRLTALATHALERKLNDDDAQSLMRVEATRANPLLIEYLEYQLAVSPLRILGKELSLMTRTLDSGDLTIPVCEVSFGDNIELSKIESLVVNRLPNWEESKFVQLRNRLSSRSIDDKTLFGLKSIVDNGNGIRITGSLTTYGSALATQDAIEWELLTAFADQIMTNGMDAPFADIRHSLDKRETIEERCSGNMFDGSLEHMGLAISTTVVFSRDNGRHGVMFGRRSADTAAHPSLFHVIPAGMFQPELGEPRNEWNVLHNVLKEYGEELYNNAIDRSASDWKYFYRDWHGVAWLLEGLELGHCEFQITGLVLNMLNLRPEICSLLLVRNEDWWNRKPTIKTNWEYANKQDIVDEIGMARSELSLDNAEVEFEKMFGCASGEWVASGLAALWLGIDAARTALEIERPTSGN
ncbi:MAG: hypothetical protein DRR42_24820, partial [Gammaproteobacteria bacterium]